MRYLARIICCAALLAFAAGICQAQASPQTGATLEIRGTVSSGNNSQNVDLFVNDADIHCVRYYGPCGNPSPCDGIFSDSYVLQGGSPSGCDNESEGTYSPFETSQKPGQFTFSSGESSAPYRFDITTNYSSEGCNSAGTICASPDTVYLNVTNNSNSTFTGTITLSGSSSGCETVFDSFNGTLAPPHGSVTLVLPTGPPPVEGARPSDSSACGGFNTTVTVGPTVPVQANGGTYPLLTGG